MQTDYDTFADQVRGLLEHEHGFTTREIMKNRDVIEEMIFNGWMKGRESDAVSEAIARHCRETV